MNDASSDLWSNQNEPNFKIMLILIKHHSAIKICIQPSSVAFIIIMILIELHLECGILDVNIDSMQGMIEP